MRDETKTERIGPYHLGRTIGMGSFGKVRIGKHELITQSVAIKILNRKRINLLDVDEKVYREIDVLKITNHPHIMAMFEVLYSPTDIFVITEYLNGGELYDYLSCEVELDEEDCRRFFQQLISGIDYFHRHSIIHRDLKPENILLDLYRNIKIADFGLSNVMLDGNLIKTSCGSPNYASPEIVLGNSYLGPEVDVWSLGVILFALLGKELPFDDDNISVLYRKISFGLFSIPDGLSDGAKNLLNQMLTANPLKRITIDGIRRHYWFTTRLARYLSFPCLRKRQLTPQMVYPDEPYIEFVEKKTRFSYKFLFFSVRKGDRSPFTALYYMIRQIVTPYEIIYILHKHTKADENLLQFRSYHKKGIKWLLGEYWNLTIGQRFGPGWCNIFILKNWCKLLKRNQIHFRAINPCYFVLYVNRATIWNIFKKKVDAVRKPDSLLEVRIGATLYKNDDHYLIDIHRIEGDVYSFLFTSELIINEFKTLVLHDD
ncbi:SNF1-related kinase (nucleomorph) [Chroomonas mesostigmatica CCMP1168]|uniref:SNF1-related kinase n=1 Tax=Chroomonas mesostigmatica CCMP1168 TaxID=1195612 RepID=J7G380_9CRYP|nr:SNF1-related kinase [Chroomonas mesostigmatica CCMP1168]|mmetsp:Transcript_57869/g.141923  ORF Transcript_57869/g.141923 Transcript_57869/m.141923 type:complete len:486 (+) Transcript_57869:200-1657(+)